jgi:hypothetical protein
MVAACSSLKKGIAELITGEITGLNDMKFDLYYILLICIFITVTFLSLKNV